MAGQIPGGLIEQEEENQRKQEQEVMSDQGAMPYQRSRMLSSNEAMGINGENRN